MTRKKRRLALIGAALIMLGGSAALVLSALQDSIVFFFSPTDVAEKNLPQGQRFRLGGLVQEGSVKRGGDAAVSFAVTDTKSVIQVRYVGLLPDLFREGQGVVTEGRIGADGVFAADSVLAKHDENYMPAEVAEALKKQGVWREGENAKPAPAPQ